MSFWVEMDFRFKRSQTFCLLFILLFFYLSIFGGYNLMHQNYSKNDIIKCNESNTIKYPRPIQFIHIPKTGGTTVWEYIVNVGRLNGFDAYTPFDKNRDISSIYDNINYTIFGGHRSIGWSKEVRNNNPILIAIFREPIERLISYFDYGMKRKPDFYQNTDKTLNELIYGYRNNTLKSGELHIMHALMDEFQSFLIYRHNHNYEHLFEYNRYTPATKYQYALHNLNNIDVVVTIKNMHDIFKQLWLIDQRFNDNIFNISIKKLKNVASKKEKSTLTSDNIAYLEYKMRYDIMLYNRALKIEEHKTSKANKCHSLI